MKPQQFKRKPFKTGRSLTFWLQPKEEPVLSLKQNVRSLFHVTQKNVIEAVKDLNKHITATDALLLDPFSSWLNSSPFEWKYALLSITVFLVHLSGGCLTLCLSPRSPCLYRLRDALAILLSRDTRSQILLTCQNLPFQNSYINHGPREVVTRSLPPLKWNDEVTVRIWRRTQSLPWFTPFCLQPFLLNRFVFPSSVSVNSGKNPAGKTSRDGNQNYPLKQ